MAPASRKEIEAFLGFDREQRRFETKGPGGLKDKHYVAVVARAVLAMANLRDGGRVCLGIENGRQAEMMPGLTPEQLRQWSDHDNVQDAIARYADPAVDFTIESHHLASGADVVVLEVAEFQDVPHLARRDFPDVLRRGALYVRPRGKPRSEEVPDLHEMRDVLDLATDKALREHLRRHRDAENATGEQASEPTDPSAQAAATSGAQAFRREREAAWETPSAITALISGAGHTAISIMPGPYDRERIDVSRLKAVVEDCTVRMRGWPLPYVDDREPVLRHQEWTGQDIDARSVPHREAWRMFTSGQFLHLRAMAADVRHDGYFTWSDRATGAVVLWDVVLYLVEVAEMAARIAQALRAQTVTISAELRGVAGRQLIAGTPGEALPSNLVVQTDVLRSSSEMTINDLLADVRGAGVDVAYRLLQPFGLDAPKGALLDLQEDVFGSYQRTQ